MDVAGPGEGATADVSARRGKFEAAGKQMRFVFLPGDDANIARLGEEIAAAIPRPFGREIAFLHTEGPALICNPVDQEQSPLMESIGRRSGSRFLHDEDSALSG